MRRLREVGFLAAAGMLCACAPLANFRPAAGLEPGRSFEVGGGGLVQGKRPFVDEPAHGAAQLWATGRLGPRFSLSGIAAFDASAFAAGGALRLDAVRTDRFFLGIEPELGFAWVAGVVPIAVRIVDWSFIYTSPRFGTRGEDWALDVPLGASVRLYEGLSLRGEYAVSWSHDLTYYQQRRQASFGAAYQF
jgi:hypothetical protein